MIRDVMIPIAIFHFDASMKESLGCERSFSVLRKYTSPELP